MGASNLPMIGSVMAPLVMIAILLEMEKLNQSLRVFLFKINHVLKQMLNTVKLITEVSIDFNIALNQPALEGITSELAELTEILALYYKVYADSAKSETVSGATAPPSSTLNRFTSSVKSVAISSLNKVGSFASRMANKLNTFASVEANKSKALDNIVIANMYFNMLFSQMEFQLKMISQTNPDEIAAYKGKLDKLKTSDAYIAISSGTVPTTVDAKLDNLIKNLKTDPNVVGAADKAGAAAENEKVEEQLQSHQTESTTSVQTGGAIKRRRMITGTNIDPMSEPFIVDRIVHFFRQYPTKAESERSVDSDRFSGENRRKTPCKREAYTSLVPTLRGSFATPRLEPTKSVLDPASSPQKSRSDFQVGSDYVASGPKGTGLRPPFRDPIGV